MQASEGEPWGLRSPRGAWRYSESIRLRRAHASDVAAMFEMQSDPESNSMAGTKARTREAFDAAWERNLVDPGVSARVIEFAEPGGAAHDSEQDSRGHGIVVIISRFQAAQAGLGGGQDAVGYWIARQHWGKGVASRALALFLIEEPRRPLHATTARDNAASQRILSKCGFRCVGYRLGEETDRYTAREIAEFVLE